MKKINQLYNDLAYQQKSEKFFIRAEKKFGRSDSWGQFHQHAYAQLLHMQIPKVQKDSQVIGRKTVDRLVKLLYFNRFVLYAVHSTLVKLIPD